MVGSVIVNEGKVVRPSQLIASVRRAIRTRQEAPVKKVFLSHPHAAGGIAVSFARWLERTFSDQIDVICTSQPEHHIDPGHMVTTGIVEHIRSSKVVLSLITPESLKQPWIFYEMGAAHALGKRFIPCVIPGLSLLDLPPQAHEYQGAELGSEEGLQHLVDALAHYLHARAIKLAEHGPAWREAD